MPRAHLRARIVRARRLAPAAREPDRVERWLSTHLVLNVSRDLRRWMPPWHVLQDAVASTRIVAQTPPRFVQGEARRTQEVSAARASSAQCSGVSTAVKSLRREAGHSSDITLSALLTRRCARSREYLSRRCRESPRLVGKIRARDFSGDVFACPARPASGLRGAETGTPAKIFFPAIGGDSIDLSGLAFISVRIGCAPKSHAASRCCVALVALRVGHGSRAAVG